ncbi:three-Cys-motif partner protein TcmP [Lentzea sp. NEAU-D13]|uniref:Three-Cys-motif partner protein TcmP n=1 Tax=Lentzea alba TaxID=2714351 RepID=A0A7C9RRQ7_9PSEU|nr:three-Cys-motif partner protein TcmP [Lentzea alba]NGY61290.1 three-Cys-motif partner protein TcmP [Lentzea alba]
MTDNERDDPRSAAEGTSSDLTAEELADYQLGGETGGEIGTESDTGRDPFFVSRKSAAVFKHSLLKSYFPKFAGKAGSTEADKRLVYIDTHAGPGEYEDGTPGSPLLIAKNVTGMLGASGAAHRDIACMFVEARRSHHEHLQTVLKQHMPAESHWRARRGKASDHLDEALTFAGNAPLFMFIDPYGLGPTFDEVVRVLKRPRVGRGSKTEILLNFISMAFSRAGGFLNSDAPTSQQTTTLDRLDLVLGGAWWRDVYLGAPTGGQAVSKLVREYARRICRAVGQRAQVGVPQRCEATLIPVWNTLEQDVPVYWLVHFTFHPHGKWCIAEAAAKANTTWRQTNHQLTLTKRLAREADTGQEDLFAGALVPQITEEEHARAEEDLQKRWIGTISENIKGLVGTRPRLDVCRDMDAIFGATLGLADGKHVRKAWDLLAQQGLVDRRETGKPIEKQSIRRV